MKQVFRRQLVYYLLYLEHCFRPKPNKKLTQTHRNLTHVHQTLNRLTDTRWSTVSLCEKAIHRVEGGDHAGLYACFYYCVWLIGRPMRFHLIYVLTETWRYWSDYYGIANICCNV